MKTLAHPLVGAIVVSALSLCFPMSSEALSLTKQLSIDSAPSSVIESTALSSPLNCRRVMYDTVLANYTYFYCWDTPSHSEPCLEPEYKQISFKNGYSRIYPDEHLWDDPGFPCPLYVRASPIPAKSLSIDCASVQPLDSFAAASQGSASLRINFAQVVDTYWLYTGLIEGKPHNNTRVHETYKQLNYKTSYSQVPPTLYEAQQI